MGMFVLEYVISQNPFNQGESYEIDYFLIYVDPPN